MKLRNIMMGTFFLLLLTAWQQGTQAQVTGPPNAGRAPSTKLVAMPDLVVTEIIYEAGNKIRVRVMNNGKGASGACSVALMKLVGYGPGSAAHKTWTMQVPALEAGKGFSAPISIGPETWVDAAFKARVDSSNAVKEAKEDNNELFNASKVIK